ncbi:MAG: bifunctional oligoribonuclease/PAP phosphatase NrnA [bacterium]
MSEPSVVRDIARLIRDHKRIAIFGHMRPDADCVGSQLALYHAITRLGGGPEMWLPDKVPPTCLFLPGSADIRFEGSPAVKDGLVVVLDTPRPERLGRHAECVKGLPVVVNIDHHGSNVSWGTHNWVDTGASATAELIYPLLKELGVAVDLDIATCLYAGIITDTGRFCYSNTTSFTHQLAGELLSFGLSSHSVAERLYAQNRLEKIKLLGEVLSTLSVDEGGEIASLKITPAMYEKSGATSEDADGFINYARDLVGIKVAVLFEELPNGAGVRISLRSRDGRIDVDKIARRYGGGGHPAAAGAMIQGRPQLIERGLLDDVRRAIAGER